MTDAAAQLFNQFVATAQARDQRTKKRKTDAVVEETKMECREYLERCVGVTRRVQPIPDSTAYTGILLRVLPFFAATLAFFRTEYYRATYACQMPEMAVQMLTMKSNVRHHSMIRYRHEYCSFHSCR